MHPRNTTGIGAQAGDGDGGRVWMLLALLCAVQAIAWTFIPALVYAAPPLDVVENYFIGAHHPVGVVTHPALPGWLLDVTRHWTGQTGWPAYLLSQAAICFTFLLTFVLGREVIGAERALAGTLLLPWVLYFSWFTPSFNHDIVQMPFWAGVALAQWRAVETGRTHWWIALGLLAGLSLYAKLTSALLLVACGLWMLADSKARSRFATRGPWIAVTVFTVTLVPLLHWLASYTDQMQSPLGYAVVRGNRKAKSPFVFALIQMAFAVATIIPLALVRNMNCLGAAGEPSENASRDPRLTRFTVYLMVLTIAPVVLAVLAAMASNMGAKLMWGTPMLNLTGLLSVIALGAWAGPLRLERLAAMAAALIVTGAAIHGLVMSGALGSPNNPKRTQWPQARIARAFDAVYTEATGQPLRIVAGEPDYWLAGLIALSDLDRIKVLIPREPLRSPWVTEDDLERIGGLIVWQEKGEGPPAGMCQMLDWASIRVLRVDAPGDARSLTFGYVVVPPAAARPLEHRPPKARPLQLISPGR
ncbi:MAG: glycosyltransferase family 39 protein [Hyphomicrobium sp.]